MNEFNWTEFLAMGGYAKYVWSSWVLTIFAFAALIYSALRKHRQFCKKFREQQLQADARNERVKSE